MNTEKYKSKRSLFKVIGPLFLAIAAYLIITSFSEFFSLQHFEEPKKFHYFFIAMPFFLVGGALTSLGYMRTVADYTTREMAPIAKDTFNYIAKEASPGISNIANAIKGETQTLSCPKCQVENEEDAKYCKDCGQSLQLICPSCHEVNKVDAKFCDQCGLKL